VAAGPPFLDAAAIARLLPLPDAIEALEDALGAGLDPEADPPRAGVELAEGQLLLMPSAAGAHAGVKLVTVAPANPPRGLPRVQGAYVLFDGATLAPAALLDGIGLTSLRTPAVSAVAIRRLAVPEARRLLVYGTGPQAAGHVEAALAVRPIERVDVVARDGARLAEFVERCRAAGLDAAAAGPEAVGLADVICCCTTARRPLFDGARVAPHATVVAIGSHEPEAREVDATLVGRSTVVVEARSAALREAGDVIGAIDAGALRAVDLATLDELVRGEVAVAPDRPRLFKSTGMAWEDLVCAAAVHARWSGATGGTP
jgi:ornithine cyclodeaminase/alanine dehydrogenase-like protein (mu-crystallin family)